ncbi:hypothetical protein BJ944DRAFT_243690 [Cunninghamella echinulata]|nr:hypothetical protein BJ944DRAFT_243690 [Cunninghamella echinulata]
MSLQTNSHQPSSPSFRPYYQPSTYMSSPTTPTHPDQNRRLRTLEEVRGWTETQVVEWLSQLSLGRFIARFKEHKITGTVILDLDNEAFKSMDITPVGERVRLSVAIKALRQECYTSTFANSRVKGLPEHIYQSTPLPPPQYNHQHPLQPFRNDYRNINQSAISIPIITSPQSDTHNNSRHEGYNVTTPTEKSSTPTIAKTSDSKSLLNRSNSFSRFLGRSDSKKSRGATLASSTTAPTTSQDPHPLLPPSPRVLQKRNSLEGGIMSMEKVKQTCVKVFGEDGQTRIVNVHNATNAKVVMAKVLHKFGIDESNADRYCIFVGSSTTGEARALSDAELTDICRSTDRPEKERLILRKRHMYPTHEEFKRKGNINARWQLQPSSTTTNIPIPNGSLKDFPATLTSSSSNHSFNGILSSSSTSTSTTNNTNANTTVNNNSTITATNTPISTSTTTPGWLPDKQMTLDIITGIPLSTTPTSPHSYFDKSLASSAGTATSPPPPQKSFTQSPLSTPRLYDNITPSSNNSNKSSNSDNSNNNNGYSSNGKDKDFNNDNNNKTDDQYQHHTKSPSLRLSEAALTRTGSTFRSRNYPRIKRFFGERPPSEVISSNLTSFFPNHKRDLLETAGINAKRLSTTKRFSSLSRHDTKNSSRNSVLPELVSVLGVDMDKFEEEDDDNDGDHHQLVNDDTTSNDGDYEENDHASIDHDGDNEDEEEEMNDRTSSSIKSISDYDSSSTKEKKLISKGSTSTLGLVEEEKSEDEYKSATEDEHTKSSYTNGNYSSRSSMDQYDSLSPEDQQLLSEKNRSASLSYLNGSKQRHRPSMIFNKTKLNHFIEEEEQYQNSNNNNNDTYSSTTLTPSSSLPVTTTLTTKSPSYQQQPFMDGQNMSWMKGSLIGRGTFGDVYLGLNPFSGELMAVKQVELPVENSANIERKKSMVQALQREIALLQELQHENIVQYLGSQSDDAHFSIFLEYVPGGSVAGLLASYGAFQEPLVKSFVRQILKGLTYLHGKDIVHRDIKGANVLVDNKGGVKISDFGISKKVEEGM